MSKKTHDATIEAIEKREALLREQMEWHQDTRAFALPESDPDECTCDWCIKARSVLTPETT